MNRNVLNLAHALPGNFKLFADFLECQRVIAIQTEAQANDIGFARLEVADHGVHVIAQGFLLEVFDRGCLVFVADQFSEAGVAVLGDRRIQ